MNIHYLKQARRLFCHDMAPRHVARHNMRAWIRSIRMLGDQWLLAQPMRRAA